MGKISTGIIGAWNKRKLKKIVNFREIQSAKQKLAEVNKDSEEKLNRHVPDPSNRIYVLAQNMLSYFAEDVSVKDEFTEYYDKVVEVEDNYLPSFPPMSPLTSTYFTYWAFCDLKFGKDKETICSIFYDLCFESGFGEDVLKALRHLNTSYMSMYIHLGFEDDLIVLREISTDKIFKCICPAGYMGKNGEIWFVRIVPNLDKIYDYSITLTTPYIILNYSEEDWKDFYKRQKIENNVYDFFKNNPDFNYWHEYIMDAYVNYTPNCIYLTGMPDIEGSKPHEIDV